MCLLLFAGDENRCDQIFVSYGPSVAGFIRACRPIIFTDACHRTTGHGGVLLSAIGLDADQGLWPLAYSFANKENNENWEWFMRRLKMQLGDHECVVMSDRNGSLITAVNLVFGEAKHSWCLRHLMKNFMDEMGRLHMKADQKKEGKKKLYKIAYAWDERAFRMGMADLGNFKPELRV